MKRHLLLALTLMAAMLFSGCEGLDLGDILPSTIEISSSDELTQTAYADETTTGSGFSFTASAAWTASVKETTTDATGSASWLRLLRNNVEVNSGDKGTHRLTIELGRNISPEDRKAEITIACGSEKIIISVTQYGKTKDGEEPEDPRPVTGITLNTGQIMVTVGDSTALLAEVTPEDATVKTIVWSSSDPETASVDQSGNVTGLAVGTATITARSSAYPAVFAECSVTVTDDDPEDGDKVTEKKGVFKTTGLYVFDRNPEYEMGGGALYTYDYFRNGQSSDVRLYFEEEYANVYTYFDICVPKESGKLVPGRYTFANDDRYAPNTFYNGTLYLYGNYFAISGGEIKVELDGDTYTIGVNVTAGEGTLTGLYVGKLTDCDVPGDLINIPTMDEVLYKWLVKNYADQGYDNLTWVERQRVTEINFPYVSGTKVGESSKFIYLDNEIFPNLSSINLSGHYLSRTFIYGPNIESINLSNNDNEELIDIRNVPELRELDLSGNPSRQWLFYLGDKLERINVKGTKIGFAYWGDMPNLKYYNVANTPTSTIGIEYSWEFPELLELDCSGCEELTYLRIVDFPKLTKLDCRNTPSFVQDIQVSYEQIQAYDAGTLKIYKDPGKRIVSYYNGYHERY